MIRSLTRCILLLVLSMVGTQAGHASPITYHFTMNTSSLNGSSGYLDLQFSEPAVVAGPGQTAYNTTATATVQNFSTDGTLVSEDPYSSSNPFGGYDAYGDVSGTLPNNVTFSVQGDGSTNEYSQPITFGNTLSFDALFAGQGVTTPICPVDTPGAVCSQPTFLLDFYDANGNFLFTGDPQGSGTAWVIGGVNLNSDTSTSSFTNPGPNGVAPLVTIAESAPSAVTPEPAAWLLSASGLVAIGLLQYKRRRRLTLDVARVSVAMGSAALPSEPVVC